MGGKKKSKKRRTVDGSPIRLPSDLEATRRWVGSLRSQKMRQRTQPNGWKLGKRSHRVGRCSLDRQAQDPPVAQAVWDSSISIPIVSLASFSLSFPLTELKRRGRTLRTCPFTINPEGEIRFGPIEVHPSLGYELTYDDNIFKERNGRADDFIQKLTPSLGLRLPFGAGGTRPTFMRKAKSSSSMTGCPRTTRIS